MKYIFLILVGLSNLMAQLNPYEQFLSFMNSELGHVLDIDIHQEQYGQKYYADGQFYLFNTQHYIFDTHQERLEYNNGTVNTINKMEKQIIYDQINEGDVTIFDILSGRDDVVEIGEILLEKSGYVIPFQIREWDYRGNIRTSPKSGEPKEINFELSEGSFVKIKIQKLEPFGEKAVPTLDLSTYEKIDLRE